MGFKRAAAILKPSQVPVVPENFISPQIAFVRFWARRKIQSGTRRVDRMSCDEGLAHSGALVTN